MIKSSGINRMHFTTFSCYLLFIFLILIVSGCYDGDDASSATGSVAFSVQWHKSDVSNVSQETIPEYIANICVDIAWVEGVIYDASNIRLARGRFQCEDHTGTLDGVPEGSNRKAVIYGTDSNFEVLYWGHHPDPIEIVAGGVTNAGLINAFGSVPKNLDDNNSGNELEWNSVKRAVRYKIQVSEEADPNFKNPVIDDVASQNIYDEKLSELSYGDDYWFRVRAVDEYGQQSAWSDSHPFLYYY